MEPVILYDRDCDFCRWSLDKILAWDRRRVLRPVAIQDDEGQKLLAGVSQDKRLESWHLVTEDGEVHSAGAAAGPLFRLLPRGRFPALLVDTFPATTERAYRAVASNRNRIARLLRIDASCGIREN